MARVIPSDDLAGALAARSRLLASLAGLDDEGARAPSNVGAGGDRIEVAADRRRLLVWLPGRLDDPTLPAIAPWQRGQRP